MVQVSGQNPIRLLVFILFESPEWLAIQKAIALKSNPLKRMQFQ